MKYLKEYNSFEQLWDDIQLEQIEDYYSNKVDFPKNLFEKLQDLTNSTKFFEIVVHNSEHVHYLNGHQLDLSGISLSWWEDVKMCRSDYNLHCQWLLNTFYTSDEWFVCMVEKYRDGRMVDIDDDSAIYYRCDGIEGLREFIREVDSWD